MKIIWITSLFPSGTDTTKGIYLYRTVKELLKYYDISTLCVFPAVPPILKMMENPLQAKKTYNYWLKNYPKKPLTPEDLGSRSVFYIRYLRLPRRLFNHLEGYFAYFKAKRIIKDLIRKDTILHANWIFPSGQLARIISKKYNIPYIVSLLGTDVHNLKYGTKYWYFAKEVLDDAKIICSVSHQLIEKCEEEKIQIDKNKVLYIDNIYDEGKFCIGDKKVIRKKLSISEADRIILYAGNLVEVKNVETLINAFSEIIKINMHYKLFIAGSGFKEKYLKKIVNELKLNNDVCFLGNLFQEDLVNYMNAADVFCLPSKNEGTPNVIIESLLCGIAVVASNVGGIPEVITHGKNGYLFEPTNIQNLRNLLMKSLKKNWDRQKLRESVKRFFISEVIKKYHYLYQELNK